MTALARPARRLAAGLKIGAALLCLSIPMTGEAASLAEDLRTVSEDLRAVQAPLQLAQASGYQGDRIAAFESVVRELTGRVENMEHRLRQLDERVQRLERATEAPAAPTTERPSAYYEPPTDAPGERGDASSAQGGPRVLGTPSESFGQQSGASAADAGSSSAQDDRDAQAPVPTGAATSAQTQAPQTAAPQTAALPDGDAATQYDHAFGLLRQARWDEAEAALEAFLAQHPDDRLSGNAKYWLGETHYVRGDYVSAARVFAEGFQSYPDSSKAPDNLLKLGMSLGMLDRTDDACGTLVELERRYGDAPAQILQRSRSERDRLGC